MNLRTLIPLSEYRGIAVFSDVHAEYDSLLKGLERADEINLFPVFIGDLIDGGDQPYEVVETVHEYITNGAAAMTIGNHDDKFYRYAIGNPVRFGNANRETFEALPEGTTEDFLQMIIDICEDENSAYTFRFGSFRFVHGGYHPSLWEDPREMVVRRSHRAYALYGETNGEVTPDNFPVRLYKWADKVPDGKVVVVGHDRNPNGVNLVGDAPLIRKNDDGGRVIFTDTGSGKGGHLTMLELPFTEDRKDLKIGGYEAF